MPITTLSTIRALDLGPELPASFVGLTANALEDKASGAVVSGSLVAFAPGVSELHQRDVLQSLLLAQLAANVQAERHKDPVTWFKVYRSVLEQTAWVVDASAATTRYLPRVAKFSATTVVNDTFRQQVTPEELAYVATTVEAYRADLHGASQLVFECPSHAGGLGNFQVALATEEDGTVSVCIAQISFNAPQHATRLLLEEFTNTVKFQVGFLVLVQNEEVYATVRSAIATKVDSRFPGAVAGLPLPPGRVSQFRFAGSSTQMFQARDTLTLNAAVYDAIRDQVLQQLGDQASAYIDELMSA